MSHHLDENGLLYLWQALKSLFAGKVDKVDGKGLSTNDYTTAEKNKLSNIEAGAEVNDITAINVNGTAVPVTNKTAAITTPTKTSDLTNDSGFITDEDLPDGAAASSTTPKMDGTAATGTETAFARGDHVHPKDTSKANLASPTFTGTPKAPTPAASTNNTQIATTAFVHTALGSYLTSADAANTYATKAEISSAYKFKGSVASVSNLPSSGNAVGDVYNVEATDMNYAWTESAWDPLGATFTITSITNAEIDAILAQ